MFKCLFALAVLGSSTCYHHHGHGHGYPSHPTYPSYRPSQDWNYPGQSGHPYGGSHGNWDFHSSYWQDGFGWYNPSGNGPTEGYNWQRPHNPSQTHHSEQTGFNSQNTGVDQPSITPSEPEKIDQRENTGSVSKPFDFEEQQGSVVDSDQSDTPGNPEKYGQDKNPSSQTADSISDNYQTDMTYDADRFGQDVNETSEIADEDTISFNPVAIPSQPDDNPQSISNITGATDDGDARNQTVDSPLKPLETNQTSETNTTITQAYITGPDNTLELASKQTGQATAFNKKSQNDTSKPSQDKADRDKNIPKFYPSTPRPIIGSMPVPPLGQFLAPSLQWHVGIYTKTETPYFQICGGSLVKNDVVITAAHCFWRDDEGLLRPALFAAAAGKLQRSWDSSADAYAQQSDIRQIYTPPRFQGAKTSFQDDIAVAMLSTPFEYAPGVKPVCVDFDVALDREQLRNGNKGTIAGWGLTEPNGPPSERLNFLKLPYVGIDECISRVQSTFLKYITSDKICAGNWLAGKALCRGDSGGGLTYYSNGIPYLRGIASTAPRDDNQCNAFTVATFTHLTSHMTFLTDHVPDIVENCRALYEETPSNSTGETELVSDLNSERDSNGESGDRKLEETERSEQGMTNVTMEVIGEDQTQNVMALPLDRENITVEKLKCNCSCCTCT